MWRMVGDRLSTEDKQLQKHRADGDCGEGLLPFPSLLASLYLSVGSGSLSN